MESIFKYILEVTDRQTVTIRGLIGLLSVDEQKGRIVLYARVDRDSKATMYRKILIVGTGHQRDDLDGSKFLGTVKLSGGTLMFHVFEEFSAINPCR